MKVSFKVKDIDTNMVLRIAGIIQGEMFQALKRSVAKKRLRGFRLEYEETVASFPPREGELTVDV